jgi:hypothetical protein
LACSMLPLLSQRMSTIFKCPLRAASFIAVFPASSSTSISTCMFVLSELVAGAHGMLGVSDVY